MAFHHSSSNQTKTWEGMRPGVLTPLALCHMMMWVAEGCSPYPLVPTAGRKASSGTAGMRKLTMTLIYCSTWERDPATYLGSKKELILLAGGRGDLVP